MIIPGFLIAWATFPGVIVHELAHALFCRLFGVGIYEVKYFQFSVGRGQPAGYVVHEIAKTPTQNIMISVGPFFVNTILGAIIGAPAAIPIFKFQSFDLVDMVLIWLGFSIAMHAFPSTGDAQSIMATLKREDTPKITKIWATPLVGIIYIGALGSMVWLDALYAAFIVGLIPNLIVGLLA